MIQLTDRTLFLAAACCLLVAACGGPADPVADEAEPVALASAATELRRVGLSTAQEQTTLQLIDNICGDTWCEGDHNFRFDRLKCKPACGHTEGRCTLTFRMFSHESDLETGPTWTRSCTTAGFTGFASLVETSPNGYQSLNWDYYEALSECVSRLESELSGN